MKWKWEKMYEPGNGSAKATGYRQDRKTCLAAFSVKKSGILVNTELSVSHQDKVAHKAGTNDSDTLSTSL